MPIHPDATHMALTPGKCPHYSGLCTRPLLKRGEVQRGWWVVCPPPPPIPPPQWCRVVKESPALQPMFTQWFLQCHAAIGDYLLSSEFLARIAPSIPRGASSTKPPALPHKVQHAAQAKRPVPREHVAQKLRRIAPCPGRSLSQPLLRYANAAPDRPPQTPQTPTVPKLGAAVPGAGGCCCCWPGAEGKENCGG